MPHSLTQTSSVDVTTVDGAAVTTGHTYSFSAFAELDSPGGNDSALQASQPVTT